MLGRTAACEIQLVHPLVSRRHCRFEASPQGVFLEDLGSSNGTFVNGSRLDRRTPLLTGDLVRIGVDGPQLRLAGAHVDGVDVGAADAEAGEDTMMAGDPRALNRAARLEVSPDAGRGSPPSEPATRRAAVRDDRTSEIPIAEPMAGEGDSHFLPETGFHDARPRAPATEVVAAPSVAASASASAPAPRSRVRVGIVLGLVAGLLLVAALAVVTHLPEGLHAALPGARLVAVPGDAGR